MSTVADESKEPALPTTPRFDRPDPSTKSSPFTPTMRWVAEHQIKVICIGIAIIVPLMSLYILAKGIHDAKSRFWAYSVDASGVITYAPVDIVDANSTLYKEICMQAGQLFFTRNPKGLSYPEFASRLCAGDAWALLQAILRDQSKDRELRNLYDQAEVSSVKVRDATLRRYLIEGVIVRSGVLDGLPVRTRGDFKMAAEMIDQPIADVKGRYPFAVGKFYVEITWSDGKKEVWPKQSKAKEAQ
jgi:hypothetical protein